MSVDDRFDPKTADLQAAYARQLPSGHLEEEAWERLIEGRFSPTERAAALDHVLVCRVCAEVYRGLEKFEREAAPVDPGVKSVRTVRPRVVPVWTQALAAALVVAVAGWATLRQGPAAKTAVPAVQATPASSIPPPAFVKPEVLLGAEHALAMRGGEAADAAYLKKLASALAPYRSGNYEEAARALGALGASARDAVEPPLYEGISLLLLGRHREAVAPLERAARVAGADLSGIAEFHLALARRVSGEPQKAREGLERLCEGEGSYKVQACRALGTAPQR